MLSRAIVRKFTHQTFEIQSIPWWGSLFTLITILHTFTILTGLRSTPTRPWPVKNGGSSSFSSISMSSSESSSLTMIPDSSSKSGSSDLSMTFAAIICWISNLSGEDMRWYRRFFSLASSMSGTCSTRGMDEGRSGFLASTWLLWISPPTNVFVFDGFRSSPDSWSTS